MGLVFEWRITFVDFGAIENPSTGRTVVVVVIVHISSIIIGNHDATTTTTVWNILFAASGFVILLVKYFSIRIDVCVVQYQAILQGYLTDYNCINNNDELR